MHTTIVDAADSFLGYSKNRVAEKALKLLLQPAKEAGLRSKIDASPGRISTAQPTT
jgi:hypothetical protein